MLRLLKMKAWCEETLRKQMALIIAGEFGSVQLAPLVIAGVGFILISIAVSFAPNMLTAFDSARTATNASSFTGWVTVTQFGPTLILLGFVVYVGVYMYMGIKKTKSE